MKFSERTLRIFKNAEMEAHKSTNIVYPIHLILGILRERTGGCAELFLHYPKLYDTLKERMQKINFNNQEQGIQTEFLI